MKLRIVILFLASAAMCTGCGIYKKYERPEGIAADSLLFGEKYATADSSSLADIGWRELFCDSLLQRLIDRGLEVNTDLKTAKLHTDEAEIALKTARLSYIPSFNFSPEGGISGFDNFNGVKTSGNMTYSVPIAASWEIDIFGRKTNEKRRSKASFEMAKDYEQAVRTGLIASIATQYYTLLMLDEQLRIAEAASDKFGKSVKVLKAMKEAGMANEVAVSQMEGAYCEVSASAEDIRKSINEIENSLCNILLETPHSIERSDLASVSFPERLKAGVPAELLSNRPDIRAAEHNLAAAYYAVNAARASLYPSLTLSGTIGWTNSLGTVVNPGGLLLAAAGNLFQPIFNARANAAQVKIMKAKQEEAALAFSQAVLNAGAEVNNALTQYETALSKSQWREKQIKSLSAVVDKTELLMKYTSTTYLDVLTAQQSLLSAQTGLAQDKFEMIQGVISLYHALGGGNMENSAAPENGYL